jgi:polysaccharide biosynthesis transport protein
MPNNRRNELAVPRSPKDWDLASRRDAMTFQEHDYTWEQVLRVLRKHSRSALLVALILSGLALAYAMLQSDYYQPTARLEIAQPGSGINALHEIDSAMPVDDQDYLATQVQVLSSDALAVSVIRELHLDRSKEFVSARLIREAAQATTSEPSGQIHVQPRPSILQEQTDLATLTPAEFAALEAFRKRLSVNAVRNTHLVEISFSARNSHDAQLITNTLISKFIDQNYRNRYTTTMQASEWLSAQLEDLWKRVQDSGQAVADYQKKNGLVEVNERDAPASQLLNEVSRQLSDAQASRIENEAYVRMIDDGSGDAIPALRDDKLYQDLMSHYSDLRTQLAQVTAVYGEANVNVKKLQDQLAELSVQIDAERNRVLARARSTYTAARHREQLMVAQREQLLSSMANKSSQFTTYHMLKEEADANAALYNTLQGRLREAGIYAGLRSSNIRVVDMAGNLPKPTGPNRAAIIGIGAFAGCLFAVVSCFVRESFRNTVLTPDDLRSWTGLPALALLPAIRPSANNWGAKPEDAVGVMQSPTAESEAMRDLRTVLLNARLETAPRVILISSSMEGEGKTTVAVNFAVALAQIGRTCLVDGDLRNPSVAKVFKIETRAPLSNVLDGKCPLNNALVDAAEIPNLSILPCGMVAGSPADVLSSTEMNVLLDQLKRQFRFVVIDSPPVIRFSDARFLSSLSDEVVLVGRYGVTTRRAIQRTAEILEEMKASIAGVVLNGIDLSSPDYDYYTYGYTSRKNRNAERHYHNNTPPSPPNRGDAKPGAMGAHA